MSKAILMSIQPKWCELITNGEKTVEVRKTRPKLHPPFKCYIYCTKASKKYQTICGCMVLNSDELYRHPTQGIKHGDSIELMLCDDYSKDNFLNGKVIGEFTCNLITGLKANNGIQAYYNGRKETCLTDVELIKYASGKMIYYWHISNLVIYDEPRELSGFYAPCPYKKRDGTRMNVPCPCDKYDWDYDEKTRKFYCTRRLTRPPQSWCYVEEISNES